MVVRIWLTGSLCFEARGVLVESRRFPGRQGRVAFAYLVSEHERSVTRDQLTELLWSELPPRAYDVGYRLNLPAAWIDVDTAAEAVHEAEAALRTGRHDAAYGPAVVACAILRRPFLLGEDGTWIEDRRRRLLVLRLRALDCLAEIHSWNREPTLALRAAEEAVELEPYRETSYRALMRIHDRAGNRAEAVRVYVRLERLLARELGTRPASETDALMHELATGRS